MELWFGIPRGQYTGSPTDIAASHLNHLRDNSDPLMACSTEYSQLADAHADA